MDHLKKPEETYKENSAVHSQTIKKLKQKRSRLGWVRLTLGIIVGLLVYSLFFNNGPLAWLSILVSVAAFLYIVSLDADNNTALAQAERLLQINEEELAILQYDFYRRETGLQFLPYEHPYAADIDLFGTASIYQYINRCTSEQSKQLLANGLLMPLPHEEIIERQEAAKSLAGQVNWRQQLQATGLANPLTFATQQKIMQWINTPTPYNSSFWKVLPNIFTAITLSLLGLHLIEVISTGVFWLAIVLCFFIAKILSGKVISTYIALSKIEGEVDTIRQQLEHVEAIPAKSVLTDQYRNVLVADKNGSQSIKELKEILKRFDFRLNAFVFIFLNTFLLWDVRQINNLNSWKAEHAGNVADWFSILAEVEVLNTLATLTFNHPGWVFPTISPEHFTMIGQNIGHPLIKADKRVSNSFTTSGTGKVSIITGSNMAGKSTFLRSLAVNVVLAQLGAPVCATAFTCSPVLLYSSMRIADNLAENTSTFYAELKKLKIIIDQVKQHKKVFILLDEILRGTNSLDRHTGSEALVKQLIKEHAVAVIATHDVELANLEKEYNDAISNYHFDVQVAGEELFFDYKLKHGVCQSMNASLLMRKIGIEM